MPSERVNRIEKSATLRISDLANKLKRSGKDVISFSVGEPDFATPQHIMDAAKKALDEGKTHYTPSAGIPELREAIANKFKENGISASVDNIIVTPGAKQAIFEVALSILNEGDEAILFDPAWVSYESCVKFACAKPVWVRTDEKRGFIPDNFLEFITDKTKLIILNTPGNPTGAVFDENTLKMIADIAKDHDILVLSDEVYEKIIYEGAHISIASFNGMHERTITVNGFSKAYAMTGWRLGYATAPPEILDAMLKIQQHSTSCATSFAQYGAVAALTGAQDCIAGMVSEFRARRDLMVNGLKSMGFECVKPKGAFYVFVNVDQYRDGMSVAERLLNEAYVAVTPGGAFGPSGANYVRISYATSQARISEGLERIKNVLVR
ncbi:MAG: pyridoxal phosphate-dependent aminotransferase [Methanosarcinales archaeon]|nr:MAG: pyridoxal phosphate-dependent aminotransferase [Methanosarcinales archaeon]